MAQAIEEEFEEIDYEYYERMDRLFDEIGWTSAPIETGTSEQPVEPDNQPE